MGSEIIDLFLLTGSDSGLGESARHGVAGENELSGFRRLVTGLPEQQAGSTVQWSVSGQGTSAGRRFIQISAQASVTLECQRCLQPFVLPVQVDNRLEVVREPSELDNEDDEEPERIVGSRQFDVLELIEDELILSLPSVPKHDICSAELGAFVPSDEPDVEAVKPSPFAVLKRLKKD